MSTPDSAAPTLTSKQRAYLRSLAHTLQPVVHVGSEGLSPGVVRSIEDALNTRELLKVRVLDGAPMDAKGVARALPARLPGVRVPMTTGRTFVVYRPFPENPEIRLPGKAGQP